MPPSGNLQHYLPFIVLIEIKQERFAYGLPIYDTTFQYYRLPSAMACAVIPLKHLGNFIDYAIFARLTGRYFNSVYPIKKCLSWNKHPAFILGNYG